jgi:ArsR family transcriptional regulator, arsenate/arsenite/antimonite-responsive transcriptional repressor
MSTTLLDLTYTARLFHALADETRLAIMRQLSSKGELCVCELTDVLDAAQSRLSFHLKTMKDAGVLESRREGRWMYYQINPEALEAITAVVGELTPEDPPVGRRRAEGQGCCA